MDNETMVNDPTTEDTEDEGFQELVEEPAEEPSESLDSLLGDDEEDDGGDEEPKDEKPAQKRGTRSEPGYVQGRIAKAVQKAVAETEARLTAQFEKQLAPFREQALNAEAQELVRSGKVKDLETAKELVRYRQGQPQEQKQAQPREAQGQPQEDPAIKARINMLQHQADRIKGNGGPDVIAAFKNNPEVKEKVVTGEWDFYDVAEHLQKGGQKKRAPAPMRSPNGASGMNPNAIDLMSDEQFDRMEKNIKEKGARYALR
jgi:hypothetical protein